MNKTLLLAAAIVGLTASMSSASAQEFHGLYAGIHGGYNIQPNDDSETILFDKDLNGTFGDTVNTSGGANAFSPGFCGGRAATTTPAGGCSNESNGGEFGVRLGYDWQFPNNFVLGAVAEANWTNFNDSVSAFSVTPARYTMTRELNWSTSVRARAGYVVQPNIMAYITGGYVRGDIDHTFSTSNTANSFTLRGKGHADGYQIGGGAEWSVADGWRFGLEYLYTAFSDGSHRVRAGAGTAPATNAFLIANPSGTDFKRSESTFDYSTIRLTLSYRFNM